MVFSHKNRKEADNSRTVCARQIFYLPTDSTLIGAGIAKFDDVRVYEKSSKNA